ncbi:MAG: IS605 OrfB-like transposable element containing RNAse H-like and Zn finger domain [Candidatus Methanohalarchaeum thermophilum]|uniref:IS605 OrfB-like transposable element containing RNAse H-like and Zn finger domain n=1 Tax=Methanohalarchaeum thermophilum TaxID=1903181 RepID=A0A1Q6DTW4_METT1|nr:MAG: IS605 OrfB-like transposable element containing RNAse H-like and Zn finger domain [Candidatus Methanohalarchaeum thermophilum]
MNVVFEEEREIPSEEDFERFVGVNLGIENIATVVAQDKSGEILDSEFFSGGELQEKRRRFRELRKSLGERKLWSEVKKTKNDESN